MPDEKAGSASFHESFGKLALVNGRALVNQLAIMTKVAQMHDLKNVAVEKCAESVMDVLRGFFEEEKSFALYLVGDYFFIEDVRIKYNVEDFGNFEFLASGFKARKLGALHFDSTLNTAGLLSFLGAYLAADVSADDVYQVLVGAIGEAGQSGISAEELKQTGAAGDVEKVLDAERAARLAYTRVVIRIRELFEAVGRGDPPDIRKLKRSVQTLVDSVYRSEPALLRLSGLRRKDDALPRHYANVCVLALGIGKRLGLSKYQMARLGLAAVLHDVGRQAIPEAVFGGGELDEGAVGLIKEHPRVGVQTLLKLKGLNEVAVSAMIVAYEHHMNLDGSGYPAHPLNKEMSLFSRIVRVADGFDAMTSSGIYGQVAMPAERALVLMVNRAGSYYDRTMLSHFYGMMMGWAHSN